MGSSQTYIAVFIVVLAVVALLILFVGKNKGEKRLTPLAGLAFGFILAGLLFGGQRLLGYGLLGGGVLLALIDMFSKLKRK